MLEDKIFEFAEIIINYSKEYCSYDRFEGPIRKLAKEIREDVIAESGLLERIEKLEEKVKELEERKEN